MSLTDRLHIVSPVEEHTHTVIFLHGRDSTADEFADEFFESQATDDRTLLEAFPGYKWVFPTARTINSARFDTEMSQWFDMWSVESPEERRQSQVDGLKESIAYIISIIRNEASIVVPERIILGGISQGCATAIYALLFGGIRLGGFIGLCSWLPFQEEIHALSTGSPAATIASLRAAQITANLSPNHSDFKADVLTTPIFLSHSKDDEVVPIQNGDKLHQGLKHLGMVIRRETYEDGGHWINEPQGVDDMVEFINKCA